MTANGSNITEIELEEKLKSVLVQFLNVNFKISDDTCLEKLLTHISSQEDGGNLRSVCRAWFEEFLERNERDPAITSFAARLAAFFASTEAGFQSLQSSNVVLRLCNLLKAESFGPSNDPSIKMAYILLLTSLSGHRQGRQLIIEMAWWQDAVKLYYEGHSIYIKRNGQNFVTELLTKLERDNPQVSEEILQQILQPVNDEPQPREYFKKSRESILLSMLEVVNHILEISLAKGYLIVPEIMLARFDLESKIWSLFTDAANNASFTEIVAKLLMLIYFASFKQDKNEKIKANALEEADLEELEKKLFGMVSLLISRKDVSNILKITVYCHLTWKKMFPNDDGSGPSNHLFENQLITVQLMPIITSVATRTADNECLDSYCNKLFALTSVETQRICYSFRETLFGMENLGETARASVLSILRLQHVMHRDRAVIVLQALIYKLKDFVPDCASGKVGSDNVSLYPELLAVVLEGLASLIATFSITWRESVETICLFSFTQLLLKDANLSTKLCVLALRLIRVSVHKFLPPNLALLMDTLRGSSIDQLGPLLRRKLRDLRWEVRDSALEVTQVVADIANVKFPAFQGHVMENELCTVVLELARDDGESYVRASALKCLAQMVRVRAFWEQCLAAQELPQTVMKILQTESEGIVRKEAAALMREMHQHRHIPKPLLAEVYETMSAAVVSDLYWEVEVNALGFWQCVIQHGLSDQGMIDGVFPKVTFSKEDRKIVTLTPEEIVRRLGKVVTELEQLGCLQVLLTALEDCDLKVVEKAARILASLAHTLSRYGVIPSSDADLTLSRGSSVDSDVACELLPPDETTSMCVGEAFYSPGTADKGFEILSEEDDSLSGHRGDKRKLNAVAGSSEAGDDFLAKDSDIGFNEALNIAAGINNSTSGAPSQKIPKIFKIDNLSEYNVNVKASNLRDKYELGCVPVSFGDHVAVTNQLPEVARYKDELFDGFSFAEKPTNVPAAQLRSPKVNNAVANSVAKVTDASQVIEDIVQSTDMNLLAAVYSSQMSITEKEKVPAKVGIRSDAFLDKLANLKLKEILAERDRWLTRCGDDLGSLLDDILATNSNSESSALDCY